MKKEFHLVLSFDTTNQDLMNTYQTIVIESARKVYASALLAHGAINEGATKPDIHLYSDDFLMGKEDLPVPAKVAEQDAPRTTGKSPALAAPYTPPPGPVEVTQEKIDKSAGAGGGTGSAFGTSEDA